MAVNSSKARRAWQRLASTTRQGLDRVAPSIVETALAEAVEWSPDPGHAYCRRCGASYEPTQKPGLPDGRCGRCERASAPWASITRLGAYDEPLAGWVRAMKFQGRFVWADWFGERLAEAVTEQAWTSIAAPSTAATSPQTWVVPVPMPYARRWHRGFNQSERIARALAKRRGWGFAPLLHRTRYTAPQTQVAPSSRPANVRRSVACADVDLHGARLLLVDDVFTSGSTVRGCVAALRERGACSVAVAVVAVADPKKAGDQG